LRKRFWFEIIPGIIIGILFVVALLNREYIGLMLLLFNSDLILQMDTLAWVVVGILLVVTIVLLGLAAFEWRRSRVTVTKTDQQTSE
jgi:uncharacterized integral membrane protein